MQQPSRDPDTLFEELLQDLPPEIERWAREFKAFTRARKVKTPRQLLRLVFLYCGMDQSLREVAGTFTLLEEQITDTSVAERLAVCGPWIRALLSSMLKTPSVDPQANGMRFVVVDASVVSAPGGTGKRYRLHLCLDVIGCEVRSLEITDTSTGESLKRFIFQPGDVVVADRGYAHRDAIIEAADAGTHMIVRFDSTNMPVEQLDGAVFDVLAERKHQKVQSVETLPVRLTSPSGKRPILGWIHAYRLGPQEAARARRR